MPPDNAPDNPPNKDDKLKDLSARLQKARGEDPQNDDGKPPDSTQAGIGLGLRAGLELAVTLLVGGAIGYFLDGFFGTRPFLMIFFGFLGLGAGVSNIYRLFSKMDMAVGYKDSHKPPNQSENQPPNQPPNEPSEKSSKKP